MKDKDGMFMLVGAFGEVQKAKKALIKLDSLVCNQFFLSDAIHRFLESEKESHPGLNIYRVMEYMLQDQVQVHPKEVISEIKEKKRVVYSCTNDYNL